MVAELEKKSGRDPKEFEAYFLECRDLGFDVNRALTTLEYRHWLLAGTNWWFSIWFSFEQT